LLWKTSNLTMNQFLLWEVIQDLLFQWQVLTKKLLKTSEQPQFLVEIAKVILQFGRYHLSHLLTMMILIMRVKITKLQDKLLFGTNVMKVSLFGIFNLIVLGILFQLAVILVLDFGGRQQMMILSTNLLEFRNHKII
jgi:hypothetical protein